MPAEAEGGGGRRRKAVSSAIDRVPGLPVVARLAAIAMALARPSILPAPVRASRSRTMPSIVFERHGVGRGRSSALVGRHGSSHVLRA